MCKLPKVSVGSEKSRLGLRLFSEPTLILRYLHMVVPASLLFIYSFFLFLHTMQSFKQYFSVVCSALFKCLAFPMNFRWKHERQISLFVCALLRKAAWRKLVKRAPMISFPEIRRYSQFLLFNVFNLAIVYLPIALRPRGKQHACVTSMQV